MAIEGVLQKILGELQGLRTDIEQIRNDNARENHKSQALLQEIVSETGRTRIVLDKILPIEEELLAIHQGKVRADVTITESELLELPDHIRKPYMIILEKGRMTAPQVAKITGRARAVESGYLNQLVIMRKLVKSREGRKVVFSRGVD